MRLRWDFELWLPDFKPPSTVRRSGQTSPETLECLPNGTARRNEPFLEKSHEGINAGATSVDLKILQELGCFDRKINGAGTIPADNLLHRARVPIRRWSFIK